MAFPIIPKKRSGATGSPTSLTVGELAVNTATGELFLGGDSAVLLLNPPTAAGTTTTERTGDGTAVAFTFTGYNGTSDNGYIVSVGGIDQPPSKYAVTNTAGGTITFVEAPTAGELISIRALVASGGGGTDIGGRAWDVSATYSEGDLVATSQSETWICIQNANTGNDPATSPTWWDKMPANAVTLQGRPVLDQIPDQYMSLTWIGGPEGSWQPNFTAELGGSPLAFPLEPAEGNLLRFNGSAWAPFDGIAVPNWSPWNPFVTGDKVYYQGLIYSNRGFSTTTPPDQDPTSWDQVTGGSSSPGPSNSANVAYWMRVNFEGAASYVPVYR